MVHGPRDPLSGRQLERRVHAPVEDRPFWDLELDMPAGRRHKTMILALGSVLEDLAEELGLSLASDNPAWYFHPDTDEQTTIYPDLLIARAGTDPDRLTADDALFVAEVVTTTEKRKELKDTRDQPRWNLHNRVPEFALFFPDASDPRSIVFHRLAGAKYLEVPLSPGGEVSSATIPGLTFRVKPRSAWRDGRKIDIFYQGELRPPLSGERKRLQQERDRTARARKRADRERKRGDRERRRAEQALESAEQALEKAEQSSEEARKARDENQRLRDRLRALGLDPDAPG